MGVQAVYGGSLAWVSDIDKGASKILAHRYPDVPNIGDMTAVDWSAVEPVDILCGGTPCQDLSHAGKRVGMTEGTRSNLWVSMREAIAVLRPAVVVWENVRGAYSAAADSEMEPCPGCVGSRPGQPVLRALGRVLGDLSDLGYDCGWHGLRAADIGAPHGRFRVFVVAHTGRTRARRDTRTVSSSVGEIGRQEVHIPTAVDGGLLPTPRATRGGSNTETVSLLPTPRATDGTKGGPNQRGSSGDLMLPSAVNMLPHMLPTPQAATMQAKHGNGNGHGKSLSIEAQRLLPTPNAGDAKQGYVSAEDHEAKRARKAEHGIHLQDDLPQVVTTATNWGIYADAIARWESLTRPAPAPTQPSKKGTPQLSPRFSEWLMGLPAGWVTDVPGITRNEALKALGNGVVWQQAEAALRFLAAIQERAA
jgi:DNA (cytosine-5)-methyltransferase 1